MSSSSMQQVMATFVLACGHSAQSVSPGQLAKGLTFLQGPPELSNTGIDRLALVVKATPKPRVIRRAKAPHRRFLIVVGSSLFMKASLWNLYSSRGEMLEFETREPDVRALYSYA